QCLKHLLHQPPSKATDTKQQCQASTMEVTEQKIARYLLDDFGFLEHYAKGVIYLTWLLNDLLKEDVPDQDLSHRACKHCKTCKPTLVCSGIAAMLIFMMLQKVNAFQMVMGIFFHCTGCPKQVLEVLSGLGLSISYSQVQNRLWSLTKDAHAQVEKAAQENDWYVVYDNINIANKHHHQRADKCDTFENKITATHVLVPKAPTDENTDENTSKNQPTLDVFNSESERPMPEADLFFPDDTDLAIFQHVCQLHISDAIVQSFPKGSSVCAIPIVPVTTLWLHKTTALPLQIMKIDESTIASNLAVLEQITTVGLQLPKAWFSDPKNIIMAGDQMTMSRLLTLKVHHATDSDLTTHFGSQQFQGALASITILLGCKCLSKEKPDFKAADELLQVVFDAMSQLLWEFLRHNGGNTNYAIELLQLLYGTCQVWTNEWSMAVLSSMLVNPKGIEGGWMPTNMFQEYLNYLIKTIFSAKGSNMSWEYLWDLISTNIRTFQAFAWMFE
ncbi:hypothetical protein BGZ74_002840, partial [Mortierella antarctica]